MNKMKVNKKISMQMTVDIIMSKYEVFQLHY